MTGAAPPALPPLVAALGDVLDGLRARGASPLPPVAGLPPAVVARALYRHALEVGPWSPLVHVVQNHLNNGPLPAWILDQAAGGWLFVEGLQAAALLEPLRDEARARGVALLWTAPGPTRPLPAEAVADTLTLDGLHGVAADPALAGVRRALLSHCRAAGPVHITGEPGTGKRSLAQWAHATLDDRPLSWLRAGQGQLRPGEWALIEEPAELHPDQRQQLARLEGASEPPELGRRGSGTASRPHHPGLREILGHSPALAEVLHELARVAPTPLPVLITGEPGTGKESLARAVHALSGRPGPMVSIDVGALSEELAESELFGHKKGAFTGADRARPGAFRAAHGGTLFLDELGNLPARLQVKLLRALQERRVQPVGEDAPVPVDVRLVAATNADLSAMVRRGAFRADLLSRLDAVTLRLPPLRERAEDLDELARGLLGVGAGRWCTDEARQILAQHRWPGNIRELGNILRYAAAVCPPGQPIAPEHLGPLSPRTRRRAPVLVVSSTPEGWGLDRRQIQALTVSTLTVPPLRDRGAPSIRAAVLHGLEGRPIEPAALDLLTRLPWWGNLPELRALFSALRALPPGPIDRGALVGPLPHLLDLSAEAPLHLVLLPALDAQGRLTGLKREVNAGAALIGRIGHLRELSGPDPRVQASLAAIRARVGETLVSAVDLSLIPQLSRAVALLTRGPDGLEVHALPGSGNRLLAGRLSEAGLRPVEPGGSATLGSAGEIAAIGRAGDVLVRIFVFLGEVAMAEHGPTAAARAAAARSDLAVTLDGRAEDPVPSAEPREGPTSRVWTLTEPEQEALCGLLLAYEGGQLKAHAQAGVETWRDRPELRRLARYLEEAPRLSQYLSRLFEHDDNLPLRVALAERLLGLPDAETRLELLPKGVRDGLLAVAGG